MQKKGKTETMQKKLQKKHYKEILRIVVRNYGINRIRFRHLRIFLCEQWHSQKDSLNDLKKEFLDPMFDPPIVPIFKGRENTQRTTLRKYLRNLQDYGLIEKKKDKSAYPYYIPTEKGIFLYMDMFLFHGLGEVKKRIDILYKEKNKIEYLQALLDIYSAMYGVWISHRTKMDKEIIEKIRKSYSEQKIREKN